MSQWSESEFREFLQGQMLFEPSERKSDGFVKAVAAAMNVSQWTLYDILKGRVDLGFDRLPALVNAIRRAAPDLAGEPVRGLRAAGSRGAAVRERRGGGG